MSEVVASYQVSAFVVPQNGTQADADQVRGNDNTLRSSFNGHDNDSGVHFQGSVLAGRPAAGQVGRKWMTTDDRRIFYDDGANWQEINYAPKADPIFTGTVTVGTSNLTAAGLVIAGLVVLRTQVPAWGVPTGAQDRTTFDPGTVTLGQLALRVASLIRDLHAAQGKHGLLGL